MSGGPGFIAILDEYESALGLLYGDGVYDVEVWRLHLAEGGRVICWGVRAVRRHDGDVRGTRLAPSREAVRELVERSRRGAWGCVHPGREAEAWPPANVERDLLTREIWPLAIQTSNPKPDTDTAVAATKPNSSSMH